MAGWYYNNIRIFATDLDGEDPQVISKHNPLGGGTVIHVFGYGDKVLTLNCVVVGNDDMDSLRSLAKTGSNYVLSSWERNEGNFLLSNIRYTRRPIWKQTLRPDLPATSPVYTVTLSLEKIE